MLLQIARFSLEKWIAEHKYPADKDLANFTITPAMQEKCGIFISLHKLGELRGCIGYIAATTTILHSVIENTVNAASKDSRFSPVNRDELDMIDVEISVISPLVEVNDTKDIKVGRDGLVVERGFHKGLLLPQVATEWGWDREEFIEQTCRKAGLPADACEKKDTKIYRFSAQVFGEKSR